MSEYIKREDAEREAIFLSRGDETKKGGTIKPFKQSFVKEHIIRIPGIDIVRCKDCKYWHPDIAFCTHWGVLDENDISSSAYCSYGERKEQEHD